MEFLRHDGYYRFEDKSAGKSVNLWVEKNGKAFWVDSSLNFHLDRLWFEKQNVNNTIAIIRNNNIQIEVNQPNYIRMIGKGKIWYGEIKFKMKYYKKKKKINTVWFKMNFYPFEEK